MKINNLSDLRDAMIEHDPQVLDQHEQWSSSLPTFGGEEPDDTAQVWSWDEDSLLVGTCADDLDIIPR